MQEFETELNDDSEEIHDIDKTLRIKLDKALYNIYLHCIALHSS